MRVRFFAFIRKYTGCAEADIPYKETIGALARSLCDLYGEALRQKIYPSSGAAEIRKRNKADGAIEEIEEIEFGPEIIFLINGRHVNHLGGPAAPLNPDDRVDVFPVVAGG
jgi:molybdopterin synthase sulfur carrier subunit